MYSYSNLRASQINSLFPGCVPCGCHDDSSKIYKVPRYDVRICYGSTIYGSRGRLVREILVECDCCGASRRYDVESRGVYENEIPW